MINVRETILSRLAILKLYVLNKIPSKTLFEFFFRRFKHRSEQSIGKYYDGKVNYIGGAEDNTFIVSFPHSGRTWLAALLANLKDPSVVYEKKDTLIPNFQDNEYVIRETGWRPVPRIFCIHDNMDLMRYASRYLYVVRDGRDVAISIYKILKDDGYPKTLDEFLVTDFVKNNFCIPGTSRLRWTQAWHNHVNCYREYSRTLVVRYEDLYRDTVNQLLGITEFLQFPCSEEQILTSVDKCSFDQFQVYSGFIGTGGRPYRHKEIFPPNIQAQFDRATNGILEKLGYTA